MPKNALAQRGRTDKAAKEVKRLRRRLAAIKTEIITLHTIDTLLIEKAATLKTRVDNLRDGLTALRSRVSSYHGA